MQYSTVCSPQRVLRYLHSFHGRGRPLLGPRALPSAALQPLIEREGEGEGRGGEREGREGGEEGRREGREGREGGGGGGREGGTRDDGNKRRWSVRCEGMYV